MNDMPQSMSMEQWCVFMYRAWHLSDPDARLNLARLYKKCANLQYNMHYALFWLFMAYEAFLRQGGQDSVLRQELEEEISTVEGQVSKAVADFVYCNARYKSQFSFGVSEESAPSDEEIEDHVHSYDFVYNAMDVRGLL